MKDHTAKVLSAGCAAPLIALILAFVAMVVVAIPQGQIAQLAAAPAFGGLLLIFIYPIMFLFGIPAYLLLHRIGWDSIWTAALIGFVAAYVMPFILQLELGREVASSGIKPVIAYANLHTLLANPFMALGWFDVLGIAIGVVFWWVVKYAPMPIDASAPKVHK